MQTSVLIAAHAQVYVPLTLPQLSNQIKLTYKKRALRAFFVIPTIQDKT